MLEREKMDRAVERYEAAMAELYKPDRSKLYSDEEHAQREASIRGEFKVAVDAIQEDADRQIAAAEEALLIAENADPTDALTTEELASANAKRDFVADAAYTLALDKLAERCRAVLAQGDRPLMFLYALYAGQRVGVTGGAAEGYMDRKYGDGGSLSEEAGAQEVREVVAELRRKLDPAGEEKITSAKKAVEEARGLKNYAYFRRRGAKNAAELYMNQKYGRADRVLS